MRSQKHTKSHISKAFLAVACASFISACSDSNSSKDNDDPVNELNIVETAIDAGNFNTLVEALQAANLDDDLADPSAELTVFAPTDEAFAALKEQLGESAYADLLASDSLAGILLYHVADGEILAADAIAASGDLVPTLNGNPVAIDYSDSKVMVNTATVTSADIQASNGVIHQVDTVITPPTSTITDIVVGNDDFETLEAAVVQANLAETLSSEGPFTVFAPTDEAFEKIGTEVLNTVLADADLLNNILTYHVVNGSRVSAKSAIGLDGTAAEMFNEESADVNLVGNGLYIDRAKISVTNVLASNGVIHVIDSVMKPEGVDAVAPDGDIVDVLASDSNFSTLVTAVTEADLVSALQGDGPFTVFAPTNAAFDALPEGTLATLLENPAGDLRNILEYHVYAAGAVDAETAVGLDGQAIGMLNGSTADITVEDGKVMIDGATVILTDIATENGIIHVIDAVITP